MNQPEPQFDENREPKFGKNLWIRLMRVIAVFSLIGFVIDFGWLRENPLNVRLVVYAVALVMGVLGWCYLEFRNAVLANRASKQTLGWRIAAWAIHPALLPVYLIGVPVVIMIIHAWWKHNHAKQADEPVPMIEVR